MSISEMKCTSVYDLAREAALSGTPQILAAKVLRDKTPALCVVVSGAAAVVNLIKYIDGGADKGSAPEKEEK